MMGDGVKLDVYKIDGSQSGEKVELAPDIFGIEPNEHVIWLAVNAEMTNKRQGTSASKNRSDVRGGGRKPWRQKGRGTARSGSTRSPVWVGGGRAFGPSPRDYVKRMPKKMRQLARRSALSLKAKEQKIMLVEDFSLEAPKTKDMAAILKGLKLDSSKTLLLTADLQHNLWLSGRNIPGLDLRESVTFSTYDVMHADVLLIQKGALTKISEVLAK